MTRNRKRPFGYGLKRGEISINEAEAAVVKSIFAAYITGHSYNEIVAMLNSQPISYGDSEIEWNKNMVARILSNPIYQGDERYPALISAEDYQAASARRPITGSCLEQHQDLRAIRQIVKCDQCGSFLEPGKGRYRNIRWNCPKCGILSCRSSETVEQLHAMINRLIGSPERIQEPPARRIAEEIELRRVEEEFACEINNSAFNEVKAREIVIQLASARYDVLGSEEYETLRIRSILSSAAMSDKLDTDLLKSIALEVVIHSDGAIGLKMRNGQIIEGSEIT